MPVVKDLGTFGGRSAWTDREGDAPVIECDRWSHVPVDDRQKVAPPPSVVTLTFDVLTRRLPRLIAQFVLLRADPS